MQVNKKSAVGIAVLLLLLILVRVYQQSLFYDPLLTFFKAENKVLPQYDGQKLFLGLTFRYLLNALISLGILYLFFKDTSIIKLSATLYAVLYLLLIGAFFIILADKSVNLLLLFYIRRFLIQPLFLVLFIPAFYYQKKNALKL